MKREDVGYQKVTCKDCGRSYTCTPFDDYYGFTTTTDGVCERCLIWAAGLNPDTTQRITVAVLGNEAN